DAKALGGVEGLTVEDRLAGNRGQQIQAQIEVTYSLAHALADDGRAAQAAQEARIARGPARELTTLLLSLGARQADRSRLATDRLGSLARRMTLLLAAVLLIAVVG